MSFAKAEAKKLPGLGCIGRVQSVGEAKESKPKGEATSGNYMVVPIEIEGYGASRSIRVHFLYRPEWFAEGFDSNTLLELDGGTGFEFVYGTNFGRDGQIGLLQGLTGGTEAGLDALAARIQALPLDADTGGPSPEDVAATLEDVLVNEEAGKLVGYVLKQQQTKTGVNPDTGKMTYANTPFYEVDQWFVPNDKGRARVQKRAAKASKGTFFVQFTDEDVPL